MKKRKQIHGETRGKQQAVAAGDARGREGGGINENPRLTPGRPALPRRIFGFVCWVIAPEGFCPVTPGNGGGKWLEFHVAEGIGIVWPSLFESKRRGIGSLLYNPDMAEGALRLSKWVEG